MLSQKSHIGFVIWGVRNGFEVMLASNLSEVEFLKSDVITDNMRQVCNTTSETFYSIHRNSKFGVVTIYHSDAKDMVGRKAYVAISLYIPVTHQFIGDVGAVLNHLKNFYIQKQADSYVNMFTAQMFTEQYGTLDCDKYNGFVIPGSSKGYLKFNNLNEIKERFRLLDINGYQSAFFIPSSVTGPENQLQGYQIINEFKDTIRVIVEGFDSSRHKIMYNNEPMNKLETNFSIEVKPGNEITFIDLINNRRQSYERFKPDQVINLKSLFPVIVNKTYNFSDSDPLPAPNPPEKSKLGNILLVCGVFISIIALVVVATLGDDFTFPRMPWDKVEDNPPIVVKSAGGNQEINNDNEGGLPKNPSFESYSEKVSVLYSRKELTAEDIEKIKNSIKPDGIKSVDCSAPFQEVKVSYDTTKIKESNVISYLKEIKLRKLQVENKKPLKVTKPPKVGDTNKKAKNKFR